MPGDLRSQQNFNNIPFKNAVDENLAAAPGSAVSGRRWYDTAAAKFAGFVGGVARYFVTEDRSISTGTGLSGGGDLSANRTLSVNYGTTAGTAAQGNDSRLGDSRAPSGTAGGSLSGSYPNPGIAGSAVGGVQVAPALVATGKDVGSGAGTAIATSAALRALGTGANDAAAGNDSRLSDTRAPSGVASGVLAGTYPSPSFASQAVTAGAIAAALIETGYTLGGIAGSAVAGVPALRAIGTGANDAAAGNDSRLSDSRTPSGGAGGVLTGTYPNPGLAGSSVGGAQVATALVALGKNSGSGAGTAVAGAPALRAIGSAGDDAMAGNTRMDQIPVPAAPVNMNNQTQTNLADPVNPQDSANKRYVDNAIQGLDAKPSVRVASSNQVALTALSTIDGITVVAGDRVLLKNQTNAAENGIWVASAGAWTRALDMDNWSEVPGSFVFVEDGLGNAETGWVNASNTGGTIGTTAQSWVQFSSAGLVTTTDPLKKNGNVLSLSIDASLAVNGGQLGIAPLGIQAGMMANSSVVLSTGSVSGILPVNKGGTGVASLSALATALDVVRKYSTNVPNLTAGVWVAIPHTISTVNPIVTFFDNAGSSPNVAVDLDVRVDSVSQISIKADVFVPANAIGITVYG